jgi:hypothetical protein
MAVTSRRLTSLAVRQDVGPIATARIERNFSGALFGSHITLKYTELRIVY